MCRITRQNLPALPRSPVNHAGGGFQTRKEFSQEPSPATRRPVPGPDRIDGTEFDGAVLDGTVLDGVGG
jgi:hypothetical protein